MLRHKEYHLTTMLKTAAIVAPSTIGLSSSGIVAMSNAPVGAGLFFVTGFFLFISLSNIIEDNRINRP